MTHLQRQAIDVAATSYTVAVGALIVSRVVLQASESAQAWLTLVGLVIPLAIWSIVWPKSLGGRRSGVRLVANFLVLLGAFIATEVIRQAMPTDHLLVVVGVVLPLFLAAEVAIEWQRLAVEP